MKRVAMILSLCLPYSSCNNAEFSATERKKIDGTTTANTDNSSQSNPKGVTNGPGASGQDPSKDPADDASSQNPENSNSPESGLDKGERLDSDNGSGNGATNNNRPHDDLSTDDGKKILVTEKFTGKYCLDFYKSNNFPPGNDKGYLHIFSACPKEIATLKELAKQPKYSSLNGCVFGTVANSGGRSGSKQIFYAHAEIRPVAQNFDRFLKITGPTVFQAAPLTLGIPASKSCVDSLNPFK